MQARLGTAHHTPIMEKILATEGRTARKCPSFPIISGSTSRNVLPGVSSFRIGTNTANTVLSGT